MDALRERGLADAHPGRSAQRRAPVRRVRRDAAAVRPQRGGRDGRPRPAARLGHAPGAALAACRTWAGTTSSPARPHPLAAAFPAPCYFAHSYAVQDAAPALRAGLHAGRAAAASRASSARAAWPARSSTPSARARPARTFLRSVLAWAAMLRRRIIPCLDVSGGRVVKGVNFVNLRDCGEPVEAALRYAEQGADEIVWLNITATARIRACSAGRSSARPSRSTSRSPSAAASAASPRARAAARGRRQGLAQHRRAGAAEPDRRGRRALRLAVHRVRDRRAARAGGGWRAYVDGGRKPTDWDAVAWAAHAVELGAGELLVTSMDTDGVQDGYDLELVRTLCETRRRARDRLGRRRRVPSTSPTRSRPAPRRRWRPRSSTTAPTRSRRRRPPAATRGLPMR